MKVCEEFISIQGEGITTGKPSYFLRLFGCNLRCSFCDSKFSFEKSFYNIDPFDFVKSFQDITRNKLHNIVITGGEPLLQQDNIIELIKLLPKNINIEIETNGTIEQKIESPNCSFNISPKLQFSNKVYIDHAKSFIVKFVDDNSEEYRQKILEFCYHNSIPNNKVYIMPEGQNIEQMKKHQMSTVEFCINHEFNYCHRVHVSLWNGKKGV